MPRSTNLTHKYGINYWGLIPQTFKQLRKPDSLNYMEDMRYLKATPLHVFRTGLLATH